jgi:hypothetical protein
MTREELLKQFLSDPNFEELGYLKAGDIESIRWGDKKSEPIIEVLKSLISSQLYNENQSTAVRKANKTLEGEL